MSKYFRFGKYYTEKWPYQVNEGVGLELMGFPTKPEDFFDIMHDENCNPVAARRILAELKEKGIKHTTVRASLNFEEIGDKLNEIGVSIKILPPSKTFSDGIVDLAVLHTFQNRPRQFGDLNEHEKNLLSQRLEDFKKSLTEIPHNFGNYR